MPNRIHRINQIFTSDGFRGPVLTLLSGTMAAMTISFGLQMVLTRLYTPAEFGVANYFVGILSILVTFTSLRYEDAMMLPADDAEAVSLGGLSMILVVLFCLVILALVPWSQPIADVLGMPAFGPWLVVVPPTLFFMRLSKIIEVWFTRTRQFRLVSAGQVVNTTATAGFRLGAAGVPGVPGTGGLIYGFFAAQVLNALFYLAVPFRRGGRKLVRTFAPDRFIELSIRYRRFSLYSTPSALLNAVIARLPLVLLPLLYFDESVLGHYGLAINVMAVPLGLIGGSIAQVFYVHAAEAHRNQNLPVVADQVHRRLIMIGIFPMLTMVVAAPELVSFVYGKDWFEAGVYLRWLSPWVFFISVASPLTRLYDVLERQQLDLAASLIMLALLTSGLLAGGSTGDIIPTLALVSGAGCLSRLIQLSMALRLSGLNLQKIVWPYVLYALYSTPFLVPIVLIRLTHRPLLIVLVAILCGLGYVFFLIWKEGAWQGIRASLSKKTEISGNNVQ